MGLGFKVQWEGSFRFWQNTFCMEKGGIQWNNFGFAHSVNTFRYVGISG
jgi:hypothetical protein